MKVLHVDTNHPLLLEEFRKMGFSNEEDYTSGYNQILEKISQYDGLIIRSRFPVDRQFLERAENLKFIGRVGAGLENIDVSFAVQQGVFLAAAPEGNRNAVGEHALALLLGLLNRICQGNTQVRQGIWDREFNRGLELSGNTVGIIGYGNTGRAFAKKLTGFNVTVLCHDIIPGLGDQYAQQVPLEELQKKSTVLSLHVPLTPSTNKMVNSSFIQNFSHPFWLINTARGKCVVTSDLVKSLNDGKILGAGLDVLEYERSSFESLGTKAAIPKPMQDLLNAPNVLLTPHVAGWTVESKELLARTIVDKIASRFANFNE